MKIPFKFLFLILFSACARAPSPDFPRAQAKTPSPEVEASKDDKPANEPSAGESTTLVEVPKENDLPLEAPKVEGSVVVGNGRIPGNQSFWIQYPGKIEKLEQVLSFSVEKLSDPSFVKKREDELGTTYCFEYNKKVDLTFLEFLWRRYAIYFANQGVLIASSRNDCSVIEESKFETARVKPSGRQDYKCMPSGGDFMIGFYESPQNGGVRAVLEELVSQNGEPLLIYKFGEKTLKFMPYRSHGETFAGEMLVDTEVKALRCKAFLN